MMNKKNFAPKIYPVNRDLSKTWFVKYKDATGRPVKVYGRLKYFSTLSERLNEAKRIIREIQQPEKKRCCQVQNLLQQLFDELEEKRPALEKKSFQTYTSILNLFATWYRPAVKLDKKVSPAAFIRYMQLEQYHTNYIRKCNIVLKHFFAILVKSGRYHENPFTEIKVKKIKGRSKLPFSSNQIEVLKAEISLKDPQLWQAIEFLYYLYLRPGEVRLLKVQDLLFNENKLILRSEVAKDDEDLLKTIPAPLQNKILQYKNYPAHFYIFGPAGVPGLMPLAVNNLNNRHHKFVKSMGERFTLYSWVHTGIKKAAMKGIPTKQLQLQKGHSDLKMFDEYLKDLNIYDCIELTTNFPAL